MFFSVAHPGPSGSAALGFVYPAFLTFKVLKRRSTHSAEENHHEMTKWLTYWCIMALYTVAEPVLDFFLSWYAIASFTWLVRPGVRWHSGPAWADGEPMRRRCRSVFLYGCV